MADPELESAIRPCHECGKPRGFSYISDKKPGKLLCAECAGVQEPEGEAIAFFREMFEAIRDGISAEGHFNRREAVKRINNLLGQIS